MYLNLTSPLILYFKRVIRNIQAETLSSRLQGCSIVALLAFFCHASYDYPFEIPVYSFTIAIFAGFLLTHGEHYLKGLHKPAFLKASKCMLILPLLAIVLILSLYFSAGTQYREKISFNNQAKTNLPNLVKNLAYNPSSWYNWYFISQRLLQQNEPEARQLAEFALKQAAIHHPNQSKLWKQLAFLRFQNFEFEKGSIAYRRYFLIQNEAQRKSNEEASLFMSQDEFDYLLPLEMPMQERTKNIFARYE